MRTNSPDPLSIMENAPNENKGKTAIDAFLSIPISLVDLFGDIVTSHFEWNDDGAQGSQNSKQRISKGQQTNQLVEDGKKSEIIRAIMDSATDVKGATVPNVWRQMEEQFFKGGKGTVAQEIRRHNLRLEAKKLNHGFTIEPINYVNLRTLFFVVLVPLFISWCIVYVLWSIVCYFLHLDNHLNNTSGHWSRMFNFLGLSFFGWFGYERTGFCFATALITIILFSVVIYSNDDATTIARKRNGVFRAMRPIVMPWLSIEVAPWSERKLKIDLSPPQSSKMDIDTEVRFADALELALDTCIPMLDLKHTDARYLSKKPIFSSTLWPNWLRDFLTWEILGTIVSFFMWIIWFLLLLSIGGILKRVGMRAFS